MKQKIIEYAKKVDYIGTSIPACQQKIGGASHSGPAAATKSSHINTNAKTQNLKYNFYPLMKRSSLNLSHNYQTMV